MVKWGILSTAHIARKNWKAIRNSGNGVVAAVASRDGIKAQQFVADLQAEAPFDSPPRALGSYDALISDPQIDALYIPLPTALRKEWVLKAAAAGKHVVCEKPCAVSLADLTEMTDACRRHQVQFMDGVMFMHNPRLPEIRKALDDSKNFGTLRRLSCMFSFRGDAEFFAGDIRIQSRLEPFGCLGDLGWYCIRLALWANQWRMPVAARGNVLASHQHPGSNSAVPTEYSAELIFENGFTSGFYCSFRSQMEEWAQFTGDLGSIRIADFVLPFTGDTMSFETANPEFNVQGGKFTFDQNVNRHIVNSPSHLQETNLFANFADAVRSGKLNSDWPEMALKTQSVVEQLWSGK